MFVNKLRPGELKPGDMIVLLTMMGPVCHIVIHRGEPDVYGIRSITTFGCWAGGKDESGQVITVGCIMTLTFLKNTELESVHRPSSS